MVRYIDENYEDDGLTISEPLSSLPMAYLTLLVEGRPSHSVPLHHEVQVGRDKRNAVVTADQKISRHHATLTPIDDTYILHDQGSANGTYVNGLLIAQPTRLNDKDKIRFGDTTFVFTFSEPDPKVFDDVQQPVIQLPGRLSSPQSPVVTVARTTPMWAIVGCMALTIIALLFIIALLLGIFVGQGQVSAGLFILPPMILR